MNPQQITDLITTQIPQYQADYGQLENAVNQTIGGEPAREVLSEWLCVLMEKRSREFLAINPERDSLSHYEHELTRIRFLDDLIETLLDLKRD